MASILNAPDPIQDERLLGQRMQELFEQMVGAHELEHENISRLLSDLPSLTEAQIISLGHKDSVCPICYTPLLAILAEEEMAHAMDSPAHPVESLGVTQTPTCKHIFCRRDISKWIREAHDSCPMCRGSLIPPSAETPGTTQTAGGAGRVDDLERLVAEFEARNNTPPPRTGAAPTPPTAGDARDFLERLVADFEASSGTSGRRDSHNEDRREYSGMYS